MKTVLTLTLTLAPLADAACGGAAARQRRCLAVWS